jgi:hypothetical protein
VQRFQCSCFALFAQYFFFTQHSLVFQVLWREVTMETGSCCCCLNP